MNSGRSAKCYVNPLNDLFRLPTNTIQRWLAADTGAHLSFCPGVSLCGAPYCERRGVGCPVVLVANGRSQRGSSHGSDASRCNNVRFVSSFTPPLGFRPTYNPVHESQREASHACPSEFQPKPAPLYDSHSGLLVSLGPFQNVCPLLLWLWSMACMQHSIVLTKFLIWGLIMPFDQISSFMCHNLCVHMCSPHLSPSRVHTRAHTHTKHRHTHQNSVPKPLTECFYPCKALSQRGVRPLLGSLPASYCELCLALWQESSFHKLP